MDYGDLQSLFTMAGPATAGWNAGVKEFQDQRANDLAAIMKQEEIRKAQQEFGYNELVNPLKVTNQGLINQGLEAELPGKRARGRKDVVEADIAEATKGTKLEQDRVQRLQTKLAEGEAIFKLGLQASQYIGRGPDAEARKIKFLESGAIPEGPIRDAFMQIPASELQNELSAMAEKMAMMKDDYIKMLGQVREQGKEQRKTRQMEIDAGRYAQKGGKASDILAQVKAGKLSYERAATAFEVMAMYEDDPDLKAQYLEQAQKFEQANLTSKAAGVTGKPDISQMGLPTQKPQPSLGSEKTKPPTNSLADVQKMYPGVPAEKLKEAYKRKFGVDLQ